MPSDKVNQIELHLNTKVLTVMIAYKEALQQIVDIDNQADNHEGKYPLTSRTKESTI